MKIKNSQKLLVLIAALLLVGTSNARVINIKVQNNTTKELYTDIWSDYDKNLASGCKKMDESNLILSRKILPGTSKEMKNISVKCKFYHASFFIFQKGSQPIKMEIPDKPTIFKVSEISDGVLNVTSHEENLIQEIWDFLGYK